MGCTTSNSVVLLEPMQLDSYLTIEEIRMVKESWRIVSEDCAGLGLCIFKKFFEMQQGISVLFGRLTRTNSDGTINFDEDRLRDHAAIVMESLGAAVECLDDSMNFANLLISMGKRHAKYNVHPDMVPFLWPAIKGALREILQERFTREVEESWCNVFEYITCRFKQGLIQGRQQMM